MTNEQNPGRGALSERPKSIFTTRMRQVSHDDDMRVIKNGAGFLKTNPVLAEIVCCLALIPFKAHDRSPST
jgi:hypothetical protein